MTSQRLGRVSVAALGFVLGTAAVGWFGILKEWRASEPASAARPEGGADVAAVAVAPAIPEKAAPEPATQAPSVVDAPQPAPALPSFDIVRVEPSGESVIAGRGVGGATVELMSDGRLFARAVADPSGLFAFVPPPLPPGSHQIHLQTIAPDGTRAQSRESVTVVVSAGRDERPLVALTAPDKPTVVLSTPGIEERATASADGPTAATASAAGAPTIAAQSGDKARPAPRASVKVASVDAGEGGRLYVSAQAAPGASVRLYLNEALVAPGSAGTDGRVSFAIGRGVQPGDYRVRLDDVDPVSGDVKSRAEVAFKVPPEVSVPLPPQVQPPATGMAARLPAGEGAAVPKASPVVDPARPAGSGAAEASRPATGAGTQVASAGDVVAAEGQAAGRKGQDPGAVVIPEISTAIVSRGDTLWQISRRIYGGGHRYTVIFGANQSQIRDPDRIYPGQVFVLPTGAPGATGG